jgi:serine/threonine-protein kinase
MGEVFIAVQTGEKNFEKRVALKLLLPHVSQEPHSVQMFLDEARISARMNHPNIVPVFDFGKMGEQYYLAMALVEGVGLNQLIRALKQRHELLPLPLFRLVANSLCEALSYSHALTDDAGRPLGVVHRDVSPSNVLISRAGAVLLTDFGIAKAETNVHATRTGEVRGKFAYMAPEQMTSLGNVNARADQFSAAVTLYEAASGISPFRRANEPETIDAVRGETVPLLSQVRTDVPVAAAKAIARAMSRDPRERFDDMASFRVALLDGPLAAPQELGALVTRVCPDALMKLTGTPAAPSAPLPQLGPVQTLSVPLSAIEVAPRSPRSRQSLLAFAGALAVVLGGGLSSLLWPRERAPVAEPSPAAASPEEEPEEEEPVDAGLAAESPVAADAGRTHHALAAPRKRGMSSLSADAKPWAEVLLDGRVLDHTPIAAYPVMSGVHEVTFRHPQLGTVKKRVRFDIGVETTLRADVSAGTVRVGR